MISHEELTKKHEIEEATIKETLKRALETDGVLLYVNHMMDSSSFGKSYLILFGPGRTIPNVEKAPDWIDPDRSIGVPSRRAQLVGEVDVADLRKNA